VPPRGRIGGLGVAGEDFAGLAEALGVGVIGGLVLGESECGAVGWGEAGEDELGEVFEGLLGFGGEEGLEGAGVVDEFVGDELCGALLGGDAALGCDLGGAIGEDPDLAVVVDGFDDGFPSLITFAIFGEGLPDLWRECVFVCGCDGGSYSASSGETPYVLPTHSLCLHSTDNMLALSAFEY